MRPLRMLTYPANPLWNLKEDYFPTAEIRLKPMPQATIRGLVVDA